MTPAERKLEAALVDFFQREGWQVATNGDRIEWRETYNEDGEGTEAQVNLTRLASELEVATA